MYIYYIHLYIHTILYMCCIILYIYNMYMCMPTQMKSLFYVQFETKCTAAAVAVAAAAAAAVATRCVGFSSFIFTA